MTKLEAVAALHGMGATLLRSGFGWNKKGPLLSEPAAYAGEDPIDLVLRRAELGGMVGLVPISLGLLVVDCDTYTDLKREAAAPILWRLPEPMADLATPGGGRHLYFRLPSVTLGAPGPMRWEFGDVRSGAGHVNLYDPVGLVEALRRHPAMYLEDLSQVLGKLPNLKGGGYPGEEK